MKTLWAARAVAVLLLLLAARANSPVPAAQEKAPPSTPVLLGDCLVLPFLGTGTRSLVFTDPIEHEHVQGTLKPPLAGDEVKGQAGKTGKWVAAKADEQGSLKHEALAGGYCWWTVTLPAAQSFLFAASGHASVYVNGEPRVGDVYGMGIVRLPVRLHAGANHFLFRVGRGGVSAKLEPVTPSIHVFTEDATLPDVLHGPSRKYCAGILLANSTQTHRRILVSAKIGGETSNGYVNVGPCSVRKARIEFKVPDITDQTELALLVSADAGIAAKTGDVPPGSMREFKLAVRSPVQNHRVTFTSSIDGSVQYYAVNPARPLSPDQPLGIVLSCHGAGVEATGQAAAYGVKSWCHVVCPTNRRHYGFDWEDWGRQDAMEVLAHAKATLKHDPSMVYLTGHSMGGHGAWQLAAHFPDKFAAVGPSAGWRSFWSYGGKQEAADDPVSKLLRRAENASDTMLLKQNYAQQGVYILHGDADDVVPAGEARFMRDALKEFHNDIHYHEEPGAGHWWDRTDARGEPGADCVDWQPMFDLFARRRIPSPPEVREIDFTTVSPSISASCHWASIIQQRLPFSPSRIQLRCDPQMRRVVGSTHNVQQLNLSVGLSMAPGKEVSIELDGEKITAQWPANGVLQLRWEEKWFVGEAPSGTRNPARGAGFRGAFSNNCVIVYGTGGDSETRQWASAKARFDAEQFWYRGNGSIEVLPDSEFDAAANLSRNVILVGDAGTNSAFAAMGVESPVRVQQGKVLVNGRSVEGSLALLVVAPKPGSVTSSIGIISGTNPQGMRLTNRIPYLSPGVGVPDFIVFDTKVLQDGVRGVRVVGFFDNSWRVHEPDTVTQ